MHPARIVTGRLHGRMRGSPRWLLAALLLGVLGLLPSPAQGQSLGSVAGRVLAADGPLLAGAVVRLSGDGVSRAVLSDSAGQYLLAGLPPGTYLLSAARLGYRLTPTTIQVLSGISLRHDLVMDPVTVEVEGVVIEAPREIDRERDRFDTEAGLTARVIRGDALKSLPGLAEADVLRAIEVLPGVVTTSDFSSAFNVRGGSADQNLILLDGFPLFNPFHLGGLFSVFNSDAVARAELMAGGFGAEYGGRVSSVLNVETRDGGSDGLRIEGGLSMLATRLQLRAPLHRSGAGVLGGERGSWLFSARRSYFDQLLRPVVSFPYHLTDLQGRVEMDTRGGGNLSLTLYGGGDLLDLSDFDLPGEDSTDVLRIRWNWGNRLAGLHWRQPLGAAWIANSRVGYSRYTDRLGFIDFDGVHFSSRVDQLSSRLDLTRTGQGGNELRFGGAVERLEYSNLAEAGGTPFLSARDRGVLGAAYTSYRWQPDDDWLIEPGLRLDVWHAGTDDFVLLSPRFAVKHFLGSERDAAIKLAVGRYTQFLHSMRDEALPVSNDTWVAARRGTPALISDQVQLGVDRYWENGWSASLEGYYRTFDGVTDFNLLDDPNDPFDDVLAGRGTSFGADLLVRRERGALTGWATLSLLRAERTMPDPASAGWDDLPTEVSFPPVFDRRVDLDLVLQYDAPRNVEVGLRWNFGSPLPYTRPVGQYMAWRLSPIRRQYEPLQSSDEEPPLYAYLGERNGQRYPPYHRLDLTVRRRLERSWGSWTPYLQVLNAYNRKNVLWYFFNYDRTPPTRSGLSMFPILPAVGVEMTF